MKGWALSRTDGEAVAYSVMVLSPTPKVSKICLEGLPILCQVARKAHPNLEHSVSCSPGGHRGCQGGLPNGNRAEKRLLVNTFPTCQILLAAGCDIAVVLYLVLLTSSTESPK
uniref:Uncharacterized protein n=1 Tax=Sphaerodactylus townsendi TaxID=933632 RepID=A0ACB8EZV3_9SAUR